MCMTEPEKESIEDSETKENGRGDDEGVSQREKEEAEREYNESRDGIRVPGDGPEAWALYLSRPELRPGDHSCAQPLPSPVPLPLPSLSLSVPSSAPFFFSPHARDGRS